MSEENVTHALKVLPKELKESYDMVLNQILASQKPNPEVASRAFKWLMCAQRPLRTAEFVGAIAVDSKGKCSALQTANVLSICCNLVVEDKEQDVFRFAHQSVQEYLEGHRDYTSVVRHSLALERCLHSMQMGAPSTATAVQQNEVIRPYSMLYWPVHFQGIEGDQLDESLKQKLNQFFFQGSNTGPAFAEWVSTVATSLDSMRWDDHIRSMLGNVSSSSPAPLFLACSFGLPSIVERLKTFRNVEWNQTNVNGNTGLHLAARYGHESIVKSLLDDGADIHAKTNKGETALYWTIESIPGEVWHHPMLMDGYWSFPSLETREAKAETISEWTALHKAAYHGQESVAGLLLNRGAKLESPDNHGATALHWAAAVGDLALVQLLLDRGAKVNAADRDDKWTALHRAAYRGQREVVELLLKKGADVNARTGRRKWIMLHLAAGRGHEAVVRLLLDNGADVSIKADGEVSQQWKRQPMARYGRAWGNIDMVNDSSETALSRAAKGGHEAVVRLLLEGPL
jgi:ankyrin repeat protein